MKGGEERGREKGRGLAPQKKNLAPPLHNTVFGDFYAFSDFCCHSITVTTSAVQIAVILI